MQGRHLKRCLPFAWCVVFGGSTVPDFLQEGQNAWTSCGVSCAAEISARRGMGCFLFRFLLLPLFFPAALVIQNGQGKGQITGVKRSVAVPINQHRGTLLTKIMCCQMEHNFIHSIIKFCKFVNAGAHIADHAGHIKRKTRCKRVFLFLEGADSFEDAFQVFS